MKYHYQYVSPKAVRIELIPEDKKELALLKELDLNLTDASTLHQLFEPPLSTYAQGIRITKINFMDFPKVALISFEKAAIKEKTCA